MLNSIILQKNVHDRWRWNLCSSKNYTFNSAYNFFQQSSTEHNIEVDNLVFWHKDISHSLSFCVVSSSQSSPNE